MLVASVDCRQVAGIDNRTADLPYTFHSDACAACAGACSASSKACGADSACAALAQCILSLPIDDVAGRAACEAAHPITAHSDDYLTLDRCLRSTCAATCYGSRGLFAGFGDTCDACLASSDVCGDPIAACIADGTCERAYSTCMGDVSRMNPAGVQRCFYGFDGKQPSDAVEACTFTCLAECAFGTSWQCVGKYEWDRPALGVDGATFQFPISEATFAKGAPAVGVVVDACGVAVDHCEPLVTNTVDATGVPSARIPFNNFAGGFGGYFRLSGSSRGTPIYPELAFLGYPIVHDERTFDFGAGPTVVLAPIMTAIAQMFSVDIDPSLGIVAMSFLDCSFRWAPGVSVAISPQAVVNNATNATMSTKIAYFGATDTTARRGVAYAFNVRPGCVELTAHVPAVKSGTSHRQRVLVHAGTATLAVLSPRTASDESAFQCTP